MSWSGLPEIIEARIIPEPMSGCWIWLGPLRDNKEGYGGASYQGKTYRAHKLVYQLLRAEVSKGLTLDHLCRNRICCNPDHLEPTTWKINIHRGIGVAPKNLAKSHCPQGHLYDEANTYHWNNQRFCRTCSRGYKRNYNRRRIRRNT